VNSKTIIEFVLAIAGATFISAAFSALTLTVLSYFDLVEIGKALTYSILTLLYLPLFGAYFARHDIPEKLSKSRHLSYILTPLVPILFVSGRFFEGTLLLSMLISMLREMKQSEVKA
jgi:hypothetical protein